MNEAEIKALLDAAMPGAQINLAAEGNKLSLRIISQDFEGLNRVKRQQVIYAVLNEKISSGEIHAVSMQCQTPSEIDKQDS